MSLGAVLFHADGAPRGTEDELADALVWLALGALAHGTHEVPEVLLAHLDAFAARAGITPDMSAEDQRQAVARYFELHPLPVGLRTELEAELRAMGETAVDGALLGINTAKMPLVRAAPPPEGTVAAGPFARFQLKKADR